MHDSTNPLPRVLSILVCVAWLSLIASTTDVHAQGNLIDGFTPSQVVAGQWRVVEGELIVGADPGSRAVLAVSAPSSYSLTVEFTRTDGKNSVGVILPVGSSQCAFILSLFSGEAHGIGIIDGMLAKQNASTLKPGELETGHPYRLIIEVDVKGDSVSIASTLDGRECVQWSGPTKSLTMLERWRMPSTSSVGLITYGPTTFHAITLAPLNSSMRMTRPVKAKASLQPSVAKPLLANDSAVSVLCTQGHGEPSADALNRLASSGSFRFQSTTTPMTTTDLASTDVLVIRVPKKRFSDKKTNSIIDFVRSGGSLLLVMDEERRTPLDATGVNEIIQPFGLAFTDDIDYLHNCGAICQAGDIHSADCEVPFSGGRSVTGGIAFGYQLDTDGSIGAIFATSKIVNSEKRDGDNSNGRGRIVILGDGMAAGLMGTNEGERLSGVPRNPAQTTYWGKDSVRFMTDIITWLAANK